MKIVVPVKLIPDLVEDLIIDESGAALDTTWMRLILNEFDDHAIEQGILLKERHGGEVIVIAPDVEDVDESLFNATARGADRVIKLAGEFDLMAGNRVLAGMFAEVIRSLEPDLVLTGVQAHDDLDGQLGPVLAEYLGFPYIGYIAGVASQNGSLVVRKEYPGGLIGEFELSLPAVLGIQAADEPPRYVAFSKIRQAAKKTEIEEQLASVEEPGEGVRVGRLFQPEVGEGAEMLAGEVDTVVARLIEIFSENGIL